MTPKTKRFILDTLRSRNTMTLATIRPDGYPQATTVVYANDGLVLYFMCDRGAQKVRNLGKNDKVSLTIDGESSDWTHIHALSMGATAEVVNDPVERRRATKLLSKKFPQTGETSEIELADEAIVRVTPKVISAINYDLGFGHTELVRISRADVQAASRAA